MLVRIGPWGRLPGVLASIVAMMTGPVGSPTTSTVGSNLIAPSPAGFAAAWHRRPGYLDTATYGLPPIQTVDVGHRVIDQWADGSVIWHSWNDAADEARGLFAALVGVAVDAVAVGPTTSSFVGVVAASLSDDAEVVIPEGEFTSLLFPFLVQQARGVTVRVVPLEGLAESVRASTTVVAWSAVQSSDGRIADTAAVLQAAHQVDAITVVDVTQAAGWLPLPLGEFDAAVCSAYKWLCCPRGVAFMVASPRVVAGSTPHAASWFATDDVHSGYYGPPLRLATDARRFDVSPAWFAWTGAVASLSTLLAIGTDAIHEHDVALADGLRADLGVDPTGSAIVSIGGDALEQELAAFDIKAATRASGCRLSFHVYNDADDVAAAAAALRRSAQHLDVV